MNDICWLTILSEEELSPQARADYERVRRGDGTVHNLYRTNSIWPTAMLPSHRFYQAIMHAPDGPLTLTERELVATHVAALVQCEYAFRHHGRNLWILLREPEQADAVLDALAENKRDADVFAARKRALLAYNEKLTRSPGAMAPDDLTALQDAGLTDAEILHLNQISASFNYWVRFINGLGIRIGEESVGMDADALFEIDAAGAAAAAPRTRAAARGNRDVEQTGEA